MNACHRAPQNLIAQAVNDTLSNRIGEITEIKTEIEADIATTSNNLTQSGQLVSDANTLLASTQATQTSAEAMLESLKEAIANLPDTNELLGIFADTTGAGKIGTSRANTVETELTSLLATDQVHDSKLNSLQSSVSGLISSLPGYAPLASPVFTGTPEVPTADLGTNTAQAASTAFVAAAIAALSGSAPELLDTLKELADALGNDPDFAATMTEQLSLKAPLADPVFTGTPEAPTADPGTNTTQLATTAFVTAAIALLGSVKPTVITNYYYTVVGGESTITVPSSYGAVSVPSIYIEGVRQDVGYGFTFDASTGVITLAQTLDSDAAGSVITVQIASSGDDDTASLLSLLSAASGATLITTSDNTTVQAALDLKAPKASPTFTGSVTIPTPATSDNSTLAASTAFVRLLIQAFGLGINGATGSVAARPGALINTSATQFISALTTDSQATYQSPVSGERFGGLHVQRDLRPAQFGVSGQAGSASFWYRGFNTTGAVASEWKKLADAIGVTDASNADAGYIGEVLTATGTATSHTTATTRTLASLSLTPGDWEVEAVGFFDITSGATAVTIVGLGTTTTVPAFPNRTSVAGANSYDQCVPIRRRFNISAATTIYLTGYCEISSGTVASNGYLEARRVR